MGFNDRMQDSYPTLPRNAGKETRVGFEPNNDWLLSAPPELRNEAMRMWFVTRFWDPANDTPYNSREGGYIYINGGPYDAEDMLSERFEELLGFDVVRKVVDEIESDGIYEWAPIHTPENYDHYFDIEIASKGLPYQQFLKNLSDIDSLKTTLLNPESNNLLRLLLYTHLITALETYLSDCILYWVKTDQLVLKRFVSNCNEFKEQKIPLSDIFNQLNSLSNEVEKYIQKTVWHRLDKVIPLFTSALDIERPKIQTLMKHIITRHDIVHRSGKKKDGEKIEITDKMLDELKASVREFVDNIETNIIEKQC